MSKNQKPKKPLKKRKQCSKNRWQGFERFIAFAIGGQRVLGQAAKFSGRKDTYGDAQSEMVVAECKARDPAPKIWREKNPQVPYNKIKLETKWLVQLAMEAKKAKKHGFLAYSIKYEGFKDCYLISLLEPLDNNIGKLSNTINVDPDTKKFTFDVNTIPNFIIIEELIFKCYRMKDVMNFFPFIKYESMDELIEAWKTRNKDDKTN